MPVTETTTPNRVAVKEFGLSYHNECSVYIYIFVYVYVW